MPRFIPGERGNAAYSCPSFVCYSVHTNCAMHKSLFIKHVEKLHLYQSQHYFKKNSLNAKLNDDVRLKRRHGIQLESNFNFFLEVFTV